MRATVSIFLGALMLALAATAAVAETFTGTSGPDTINGSNQADRISGLAGNDSLNGRLAGDLIYGGDGNDTVTGQPGNDSLYGSEGNDDIFNNDGQDEAFGGPGDDSIVAVNDTQVDFINCGPGTDFADIQANDVVDDVRGSDLDTTTQLLSCERVRVNGVLVIGNPLPTG